MRPPDRRWSTPSCGRRASAIRRVIAAMSLVPREKFVPDDDRPLAYVDRAIPLGEGRAMPAPSRDRPAADGTRAACAASARSWSVRRPVMRRPFSPRWARGDRAGILGNSRLPRRINARHASSKARWKTGHAGGALRSYPDRRSHGVYSRRSRSISWRTEGVLAARSSTRGHHPSCDRPQGRRWLRLPSRLRTLQRRPCRVSNGRELSHSSSGASPP